MVYHVTNVLFFSNLKMFIYFPFFAAAIFLIFIFKGGFYTLIIESMIHGISLLTIRWKNSKFISNLRIEIPSGDHIEILTKLEIAPTLGYTRRIILAFSFSLKYCHGIGSLFLKNEEKPITFNYAMWHVSNFFKKATKHI